MVRRNLDVEAGLVNGAIATVVRVNRGGAGKEVKSVTVRLHDTGAMHDIERCAADYEVAQDMFVTRRQLPLSVAYAITIHKVPSRTHAQVTVVTVVWFSARV
jgi:hypothetical protein